MKTKKVNVGNYPKPDFNRLIERKKRIAERVLKHSRSPIEKMRAEKILNQY